jgi:putative SOS response-associated peptidase YedK
MPVLVLHFVPISSHVSRPHSPYTSLMCGRYRLARKKEILAETFDVENDVEWSPRYNVAPRQDVVVVRQDATRPVRTFSLVRWGLVPSWSKDAKAGFKMINARTETVASTPVFRDPFRSRRCLILADGFYEWSKQGKQKSPFCFSMADDSIFAFAGIWDRWKNPDKECVETCSIITTSLKQQVRNKLLGAGAAISPPIGAEVQIWFPRFCTKSRNRGSPFSRKQNSNASHSRPLLCATIV